MTVAPGKSRTYTEEEYLALEVESDIRSEYRDGEIVPMTGGTPEHNEIGLSLSMLLRAALSRQSHGVFITDQRLWVPEVQLHTYPDVMVAPRPLALEPGRRDTLMSPILIAEVLSKSTQAYDRGDKFAAYRTIPTLQEYLLVDQYRPHLERYEKQANRRWLFVEYDDLEEEVSLATVPVRFALKELYEGVLDN